MKNSKSETLINESTSELMSAVLSLFSDELTAFQKGILTETLVNHKSFTDVKTEIGLTLPRQKMMFQQGVRVLNSGLRKLKNLRDAHEKLMRQHSEVLAKLDVLEKKENKLSKFSPEIRKTLAMSIEKTTLSNRVVSVCQQSNIFYVSDLVKYRPFELTRMRNCGRKSITEMEDFLLKNDLHWGMLE